MNIQLDGPLVLVGCGNMGGAMLKGWLERGLDPAVVCIQEPEPSDEIADLARRRGIALAPSFLPSDFGTPAGVLLMAVKPQMMDTVLADAAKLAGDGTVVLSVAAGKTIAGFEARLPENTAVVRAIPNTPAAIGRGMTVCAANAATTAEQRATCTALLEAIGRVGWVDDEALIDAATAVSGSGPAYVFLLCEALAQAAIDAGLPGDLARDLAEQTVSGAGELIRQSDEPASVLRNRVTSPGGTTQAALDVLMAEGALPDLMRRAVLAARDRSVELAG